MHAFIRKHPYLFWSSAGVAGFFLSTYIALYIYVQIRYTHLPSVELLRHINVEVPLRIYTHNGVLLGEFGEIRRTPLKFEQIPKLLVQAFLAAEDDDFYKHSGIDMAGMLRSVYVNLREQSRAQGASTITMQLARNYFLTNVKTWRRKRDEIILAWKIENEFSKDEILELYLNKIYFGNRAYGIAAAAQVYYGKSVDQLNVSQMAMIAGLPKAPSSYNPIVNPKRALQRRNYVLHRMVQLGYIVDPGHKEALAFQDDAQLHSQKVNVKAFYIAEMVRQEMLSRYGEAVNTAGYNVYTTVDGDMQEAANTALRAGLIAYDQRQGYRGPAEHVDLNVYTGELQWEEKINEHPEINGLIPVMVTAVDDTSAAVYHPEYGRLVISAESMSWATRQMHADSSSTLKATDVLHSGDVVYVMQQNEAWWLAQVPLAEGALVALSPKDGQIKALVGGFDYFKSKYNRATQALRQPGSNFKPFIYSAALEKEFTTASIINDAPIDDADWRPENSDYQFEGPITLRHALAHSKNMVAIRVLQAIGVDYARDYITRFGFDSQSMPNDLTLALGSAEVTPLKLAQGFSVFANGGYAVEPSLIKRIEDSAGNMVWQAPELEYCDECMPLVQAATENGRREVTLVETENNKRLAPRVISKQNAYLITSMLRDAVAYGTGKRAKVLNRNDLAGKTGTTNDQKDAWFTGYNEDIVATAWIGYDQPQSLGANEFGGRAALPVWINFMRTALRLIPEKPLILPDGMTMVRIDPATGTRACTGDVHAVFEPFALDKAPKDCTQLYGNPDNQNGEDNPFMTQ